MAGQGGTGVGGGVHGGQALGGHTGVDMRGGEAAVPEQLLDVADVRPALQTGNQRCSKCAE